MRNKIYHIISIILTIAVLLLSFHFSYSYFRIFDVILDFIDSLAYFSNQLFGTEFEVTHGVVNKVYDLFEMWLPVDFKTFKNMINDYFVFVFNPGTFELFKNAVIDFLLVVSKILMIFIPIVLLLNIFIESLYFNTNNREVDLSEITKFNYSLESKPLIIFKHTIYKLYLLIKNELIMYFDFLKRKKVYKIIWIIAFAFYFNFFSIIIHFLAYYFYFVFSYDFLNLYIFIYKILFDLMPMILFVPWYIWVIIGLYIFNMYRKKIAMNIFYHFENRNRGFINSLGLVSMTVGPPGTSKTLTNTDMTLSQEIMFRDKALEKMLGFDYMFPHFPFINLEKEIQRAYKFHQIYNLASSEIWIRKKIYRFNKLLENGKILPSFFGYNYVLYPLSYFNGYKEISLFELLESYTKAYYVYILDGSLILSNYAIRSDNFFDDIGNLPLWYPGLFNTDINYVRNVSRYSRIIDFDSMRLLKKLIPGNKTTSDVGVTAISEAGKERGNQFDHRSLKKDSEVANQLNDGFNMDIKMERHKATIDNFAFIKIFLEDQRAESIGADARELCERIIHIKGKSDYQNPLLFFNLEYRIYLWFKEKWDEFYKTYRYYRSDNTLLVFLLKSVFAMYNSYIMRLYNGYGYFVETVAYESGTLDGNLEVNKYYLMFPKIFANRYSTDCFSDFFVNKALLSNNGLQDLPEYESHKASIEELAQQNSYFINDMIKHNIEGS